MLNRPLTFLVYDTDESIKGKTSISDLMLFNTYTGFSKYVNENPCIVQTLIITSIDLPFTNSTIGDFIDKLKSPFLRVDEVLYLVGPSVDPEGVEAFLDREGLDNWRVIAGDVGNIKFIESVVSGEGRLSNVSTKMVAKYRVSVEEYAKYNELTGNENKDSEYEYYLEKIEPDLTYRSEDIRPESNSSEIFYVVGGDNHERTSSVLVLAQYISLNNKVIIIEKDVDYHRLTDYVTKLGIECDIIWVESMYEDLREQIKAIEKSTSNLVVVACKKRFNYNYSFIFDLIYNNVQGKFTYIKECEFEETPYGCRYIVVSRPTVPDILKTVNELRYEVSEECMFVMASMMNINPIDVTMPEARTVLSMLLSKNVNYVHLLRFNGLKIKGGSELNDLSSIVNHFVGRHNRWLYSSKDEN